MAQVPTGLRSRGGPTRILFESIVLQLREWYQTAVVLLGSLTVAGKIISNDTTDATSPTTGAIQTDGGLGVVKKAHFGNRVTVENTTPQLRFIDTNESIDEGDWEFVLLPGGSFNLQALTEAGGGGGIAFSVTRTGTVIDAINFFGNVGIDIDAPDKSLEIRNASPVIRLRDTGATADGTNAFLEFGGTDAGIWVRTGWVGDGSSGNTDISLRADVGNLILADSSGVVLTLSGGNATFTGDLTVDTIDETTTDAGVTIETVVLKDGLVDGRDVAADGTVLDGAVLESDYNANSLLMATSDDTPAVVTVGASELVGRKAAGGPTNLTAAEARTILNVEDNSAADQTAADIRTLGFFDITNDGAGSGLDADKLDAADWAAPAAIGSGTPAAGNFTDLDATGDLTANNFAGKNKIINGAMALAQEFVTIVGVGVSAKEYVLDQMLVYTIGSPQARATVTQESGVFLGFGYSAKIDCTTAEAAVAAGEVWAFQTRLEAQNLQDLKYGNAAARALTLTFRIKSPKTGVHCVALHQPDGTRSYIREFTVVAANTDEEHTVTFPGDASGTINNDTGEGLYVTWPLVAGSTYQVAANGWAAGEDYATSNQQNLLDNTANNFEITGIQLEVGEQSTEFDHRPFGIEVVLCQRFYCKSYDLDVAPGTSTSTGSFAFLLPNVTASAYIMQLTITFPVSMRAAPSVDCYDGVPTLGKVTMSAGHGRARSISQIGNGSFRIIGTETAGGANNRRMDFQWFANSRF